MTHLLARIMLAILMLPLAAVVYLLAVVIAFEMQPPRYHEGAFLVAGAAAWLFLAAYWILLWRGSVRWTSTRIGMTVVSSLIVAGVAAVVGAFGAYLEDDFGYFLASVTAPLLWLVSTVLIWRETAAERVERFGGARGRALPCPRCGYNLTGLASTKCPECGSQFTLDELAAGTRPDGELQ